MALQVEIGRAEATCQGTDNHRADSAPFLWVEHFLTLVLSNANPSGKRMKDHDARTADKNEPTAGGEQTALEKDRASRR